MKQYTPKPLYLKISFLVVATFFFTSILSAQLHVELTVNSGNVTTTCTDNFGSPDPHWRVNVSNAGWTTYPASGFCYQDPPFLQHDLTYTCPSDLPGYIQVCFRAFEDDGSFCNVSQSCSETICQFFLVPQVAESIDYTLSLPTGLSSWGEVNFTLEVTGNYPSPPNDYICNATDLGVVPFGGSVGNDALSNYTNICASDDYEVNPGSLGYFGNDQGVWFTFTTGDQPNLTFINVVSDPQNFGDDISIEMALYESSDGTCNGNLSAIFYAGNSADLDEWKKLECLTPNTTYFLLVDGSAVMDEYIEGYFGVEITDAGAITSPDLKCDAYDFGQIPDNGSFTITDQSNICADHIIGPEPNTAGFVPQATVWYQFMVPSSGHVIIDAVSDPDGVDPIGLQIAAYRSGNGTCNGYFIQIASAYTIGDLDQTMVLQCLEPETPIWFLIDGDGSNTLGIFDLTVSDGGPILPQSTTELNPVLCAGETIVIGGIVFDSSGPFDITVDAYNGCDSLITGMVTLLPPLATTIDTTVCFGQTVSVGNSTYTSSGNYSDVITNYAGCDSVVTTNLAVTPTMDANTLLTVESTNYQVADGAATVSASGGAGGFTYEWSDGQVGPTATNLLGGTNYCVTATDAIGCTAEDCVLVLFPSNILTNLTDVLLDCPGDTDGSLNLSISNGAAPYDFLWENLDNNSINGSGTVPNEGGTATLNNLESGMYSFTISDAFGLTIAVATILEPNPIQTTINPTLCNGESIQVGNATYANTGPISEVLVSYLGCDSTVNGFLTILDAVETNLSETLCSGESLTVGSNTYTSTGPINEILTSYTGCDSTITGNLIVLNEITTTLDPVVCAGESITVGTATYNTSGPINETLTSFTGCDSTVTGFLTVSDAIETNLSETLCFGESLIVGTNTYNATGPINEVLTSYTGCDSTITGNLIVLNEITTTLDPVVCAGESITVGTATYNTNGPINEILTSYTGCDSTITGFLTVSDAIETNLSETLCFGESLVVGTTTYAATGPINEILTSYTGCDSTITGNVTILAAITTSIDTTLCFGESIVVNDVILNQEGSFTEIMPAANNCDSTIFANLTILEELTADAQLVTEATGPGVNDGSAIAISAGGTGNYTFLWSNGQTVETATNLTGGEEYCVTITDDLGCMAESCITIAFPSNIEITMINDTLDCNGDTDGFLLLDFEFGQAPYSYVWQNQDNSLNGSGTVVTQNGDGTIGALLPGIYFVTVSDAFGEAIGQALVVEPEILTAVMDSNPTSCFGNCDGSAAINVSGGTAPYQYTWPNGTINNSVTNICAGNYEVTVVDAHGCSIVQNTNVDEPIELVVSTIVVANVSCFGESNGEASAAINGQAQTYLWDNGESSSTVSNLSAGIHGVTVTDITGCTAVGSVDITEPTTPVDLSVTLLQDASCFENDDGGLLAVATGGTEPYSYEWSNGLTNPLSDELLAGTYLVTVIDANGCTLEGAQSVGEPLPILANFDSKSVTCPEGEESGAINVTATEGGAGSYIYAIDGVNYTTDTSFTTLPAGAYIVSVQDIEGCIATFPVDVAAPPEIILELEEEQTVELGESIVLDPFVFNNNLIYQWTGFGTEDCVDCPKIETVPFENSMYQLIVTDTTTGCTASAQQLIKILAKREVFIPSAFSPNGDGINDIFFANAGPEVRQINNLRVYNRWGAPVYELKEGPANDPRNGWDGTFKGKNVENGVYIYVAEVEFIDGLILRYEGDITVIR